MPPRGGHPGLRLPPGGTPWPLQASPHSSSSCRLVGGETLLSFVGVVMSSFKKSEKRKGVEADRGLGQEEGMGELSLSSPELS